MVARTLVFLVGFAASAWVLVSIVRGVVIPRPERVLLTVALFSVTRRLTHAVGKKLPDRFRFKILGAFAPTVLISLPVIWSLGLIVAFANMYWALGVGTWLESLEFSGSSMTTLGFVPSPNAPARAFAVIEALLGLGIVALTISFFPSLYGTFSRREIAVGKLSTRAGDPPNPVTFLTRLRDIDRLHHIDESWSEWEDWFVELGETHTSFPALIYFRSQNPNRSWLRSAETALDTAAIVKSLELPVSSGEANLLIWSGSRALRDIADFYRIEPELQPSEIDRLSVSRDQYDAAVQALVDAGVVTKDIPTDAWDTFAAFRMRYDRAIVGLEHLVEELPGFWESATKPIGTTRV